MRHPLMYRACLGLAGIVGHAAANHAFGTKGQPGPTDVTVVGHGTSVKRVLDAGVEPRRDLPRLRRPIPGSAGST